MVRAGRPRDRAVIDEEEANHGKRQAEIAGAIGFPDFVGDVPPIGAALLSIAIAFRPIVDGFRANAIRFPDFRDADPPNANRFPGIAIAFPSNEQVVPELDLRET